MGDADDLDPTPFDTGLEPAGETAADPTNGPKPPPVVDVAAIQRQWAAKTCLDEINASLARHGCRLEFRQALVNGRPAADQFSVVPQ